MRIAIFAILLVSLISTCFTTGVLGQGAASTEHADVGFIGLHGGVFEQLQLHAATLKLKVKYFEDASLADQTSELSSVDVLYIQHTREEDREAYTKLIASAKLKNPEMRIVAFQANTLEFLHGLQLTSQVIADPDAAKYYGSSSENLRRLLIYTASKFLNRDFKIEPPQEIEREGFYHPDHKELFKSCEELFLWMRSEKRIEPDQPRILIAVHSTHLFFQQPRVVDALIREVEKQGAVAAAILDGRSKIYEAEIFAFAPQAMIHTCHSTDAPAIRTSLDVPHLHSIFLRKQSIEEWQTSVEGLSTSELAFHVIGQELIGGIEPQVTSGLSSLQNGTEAFQPIPERITHLVSRALAFARLARKPLPEKKVAIVYYDREMGKGELMRGSATGMHMNGPRSLLGVLSKMKQRGYSISPLPKHEDQLLAWMMERGRLIGVWAPSELDRLVRHSDPILIPADRYRKWYEQKVPEDRRKQTEVKWGPAPGNFMVWKNAGTEFLVVPRIDLGNAILLPQPLRGELHGKENANAQTHDQASTPPHNYLATYFWLQEEFGADALIHFGTHGSEFALPGKSNGLSKRDWPDIIMGSMPNFNPWIIENMVESSPVRRRAYGTLISHLPPPIVNAGLSDELANLHETIDKWAALEDGALKSKFEIEISRLVLECRLDKDMHIERSESSVILNRTQIAAIADHLRDLREETIPTSLHVFGEPPPKHLLPPYLYTILRKPFHDALHSLLGNKEMDSDQTREAGVRILSSIVRDAIDISDALELELGRKVESIPEAISRGLELAKRLNSDFDKTTDEIDNLLRGLDGRFVPPGPGNSPIRNPSSVPTGRNMVLLNPEEIPTRPSWELGRKLAEELIERHQKLHGEFPTKIGFDLRSSATFRDYGVMESQILSLIGVEPIWDDRMLVNDLRLIPREELGRPRVDVFIAAGSWYESNLPTRLNLWDKAVRLVVQSEEQDNPIYRNTMQLQQSLLSNGIESERAQVLSQGRIFGRAPGRESGSMLGYSVARSGDWSDRQELAQEYLAEVKHIYTAGAWGEEAGPVYDEAIQGTHTVVRSWSDHMTGPLASKYTWLQGGSLSLAVETLTGKRPEYIFSDVRDPDKAGLITSEDALRREFRTRLLNRKWLEGMQKEGYAGADHIRVMVSNSFGWDSMRPGSIGDDQWMEMKKVIVDDRLNLNLREWFETNNPYAYQDTTAVMLESIRKGFWKADEETVRQLTMEYAQSVASHGLSGNITSGGNKPLEGFVEGQLMGTQTQVSLELLAAFQSTMKKQFETDAATVSGPAQVSAVIETPQRAIEPINSKSLTQAPASIPSSEEATANASVASAVAALSENQSPTRMSDATSEGKQMTIVSGAKLEKIETPFARSIPIATWGLIAVTAFLFLAGFVTRRAL
jgi:cobaltochelatase CobN